MTNPPFSVVVVAADHAARVALALAVESIPGAHAVLLEDASECAATVREHAALVVLGDASLVTDGIEHIEAVRGASHDVGFVVVAERPSLTDAIFALRARVDEFLAAPSDESQLRDAVARVADSMRARRQSAHGRSVLAVGETLAAVVLGAGGTLRAHADAGDDVIVVVTTRSDAPEAVAGVEASLGVAVSVIDGADDATGDALQAVVERAHPRIVYTHAADDAAIRHRALHQLTMDACGESERISCYQAAESSIDFAPTVFVDVEDVLEAKIHALAAAEGTSTVDELNETVRSIATYWSRFGGGRACEPFQVARDHVVSSGGREADVDPSERVSSPVRT